MNRYVCAYCYGKFASQKYRCGAYYFCSRICKSRYEHAAKEVQAAQLRHLAFIRGSPSR